MFKKNKVLTREYMQDYKSKRCVQNPRMERKIRKYLIKKINKELMIGIKYGEKGVYSRLSKHSVLKDLLASKINDEYYERILREVISEYESNGITVHENPYSAYKFDYVFDLEGVFDNDN